jgi:hypothetical protein
MLKAESGMKFLLTSHLLFSFSAFVLPDHPKTPLLISYSPQIYSSFYKYGT